MTLSVLTLGGEDYNAYQSVAEVDRDLAVDPVRKTVWEASTDDNKKIYIIAATQRLNAETWKGEKAGGNAQEDKFPRTGLEYPNGDEIPSTSIPGFIERATSLLAGTIAGAPAHANVAGGVARAVRRVKAGAAEVEFQAAGAVPGAAAAAQGIGDATVHALIAPYLAGSGGSRTRVVATGTDETSKLTDQYCRTTGFA